jgi:quercetin dioxygenase-like cupin family protein
MSVVSTSPKSARSTAGAATRTGRCVEGDRMIVALMRMPAGTGAEPHLHPNERWIYVVEGTFAANIDGKEIEAKPGVVLYFPSNIVHLTDYSSLSRMPRTGCRVAGLDEGGEP